MWYYYIIHVVLLYYILYTIYMWYYSIIYYKHIYYKRFIPRQKHMLYWCGVLSPQNNQIRVQGTMVYQWVYHINEHNVII